MNALKCLRHTVGIMALIGCVACTEKDVSPVILIISPESVLTESAAGTNLLYTVKSYSNTGVVLDRFSVSAFDEERGLAPQFDTIVGKEQFSYIYPFVVPEFLQDSVTLRLQFAISDASSNNVVLHRYIVVKGGSIGLETFENITMYASGDNLPDAYNLSMALPVVRALADSSEVDIYSYTAFEDTTESLSREWRSYTGVKFVRFNEFNYATATRSGIESSYRSGMPQSLISGISTNDVILIGNDSGAIGVIKIIAVLDNDKEPSCYIFSLKKIREI